MVDFDVNALKSTEAAGSNEPGANGNSSQAAGAGSAGGNGSEGGAAAASSGAAAATGGGGTGGGGETKTPEQLAAEKEAADKKAAEEAEAKKKAEASAAGGEGGNGANSGTPLTSEQIAKLAVTNLLKELNIETVDALKEKLKPAETLTEEEKLQRQQVYESGLDNFAVTQKLMSLDEITELKNLTKATDDEVAFSDFSKKYKAENAEATTEEVLQQYKLFYNTESTDAKLQNLGKKAIAERAKEVRSVLETKRAEAKSNFDSVSDKRAKVPAFKQVVQTALSTIPDKLTLYGEGDKAITFTVPSEIKAEVEKFLVQDDVFNIFLKGDSQQMAATLKDRIDGYLFLKNKDKIYSTIYEAAYSAGKEEGSNKGATASFQNNNGAGNAAMPINVNSDDLSEADYAKLGSVFSKGL